MIEQDLPPPGEGISAEEYHAFWRWVRTFNDKPVGHLMSVTKRRPLVKRPPLPEPSNLPCGKRT